MEKGFLRRAGAVSLLMLAGVACSRGSGNAPRTVDAAALRAHLDAAHGRPVLLVFWATWCEPCVAEMPQLAALHDDRDLGVRVIAVSLDAFLSGADAGPRVVREFLASRAASYEQLVYVGKQDELFDRFQIPGEIPYAILYDARGVVLRHFEGPIAAPEVQRALAPNSS